MPHGGPFARDYWGFDYWVQFLTTRGYAVLQMNFRGSDGYGQNFEEMGYHEWGGKMLEDINDGAKWMISEGIADPQRVCIMGGSYGGYAALQAGILKRGLYKCSIAFAPVTDMDYLITTEKRYLNWKRRLR
jgi:dipeptidyl aminopeptidase/acylaminoacyl peptidase